MNSESVIKDLIFKVVLKQAVGRAIRLLPFLGWPIVRQFFTWGLEKLGKLIYAEIERFLVFSQIDFEVGKQRDEFLKAANELKLALAVNSNEIEAKKEQFNNTLGTLIRFRPK